jgi:hypothetical protein
MTEPFVCPSQLTVQVVETDTSKPIAGLYVLYRIAPPPPDPPETGLVNFLSSLVTADEPEPPPEPFQVAVADAAGYLTHTSPTGEHLIECPTESLKLGAGVAYELYFVRHPDYALVERYVAELNGVVPKALTTNWAAPATVTPEIGQSNGADQLLLKIASDPANFLPHGATRYGSWVLFKDMPHAEVQSVKDAVKQLQLDLGACRYIIGAEPPYQPEKLQHNKKGEPINQATVNEGIFDARTMSAVLHLQRSMQAGANGTALNVFKVRDKAAAHGRAVGSAAIVGSWSYLDGAEVNAPMPTPNADEQALKADAVVDAITARAIATWLAEGYRKKGAILVAMEAGLSKDWNLWLRAEGAEALKAWRTLTVALGCEKGVPANHTYRTPLTDVGQAGYGRSAVSIHKTGLAIDLRMKGFLPMPEWPVLVDRDRWEPQSSKGVVTGYRAYFRLYTPSKLPADAATATSQAQTALEQHASAGGVLGQAATTLLTACRGGTLISTYFKDTARSWNYDAYHDEGGTEGPEVTAEAHFHDPAYTRWLDLTLIASLCGLRPIGSFTNKISATSSDWGVTRTTTVPDTIKKFTALADGLTTAKERVHDPVDISVGKQTTPLASANAAFLKQYAGVLGQFPKPACTVSGARLVIKISWSSSIKPKVEEAAGKLEGLGSAGKLMGAEDGDAVRTAAEWGAWLREKLAQLDPAVPANQTTGGTASSSKPPSQITLVPVISEAGGVVIPVKHNVAVSYPAPGNPIGMEWWHFQQGPIVSSVKRFGTLLTDLGWTDEGLLNTASVSTHYRTGVGYPQSELDKKVG